MAKQKAFSNIHNRSDYKDDILDSLTPADVKVLIKTCEELRVTSEFTRIFPTAATHKYLTLMKPEEEAVSYYDKLLDSFMSYCRETSFLDGVQHDPRSLSGRLCERPPRSVKRYTAANGDPSGQCGLHSRGRERK